MKMPDAEKALKLYYEKTEIDSAEIRELFNCNSTTATRLKKQVQAEMAKTGVKTWMPRNVDVQTAYKVWCIDVDNLERKLAKLQKLKSAGIIKNKEGNNEQG